MGGDAQVESLVQLRNTSKPPRFGLIKNLNKFMRLAFVRFERIILRNHPRKLSKAVSEHTMKVTKKINI
ncbi:hypothetical protein DWB61_17400 [Ancylomarina euxinus]|uniref:Uncharacterized protein n=1 Tax=Ancylomarina euxinus TaxID=2283627 RepID=A0A425XWG0_9BACT|nr:hypothetical protein DWB61_17400 [Ancylomarina euxinus]